MAAVRIEDPQQDTEEVRERALAMAWTVEEPMETGPGRRSQRNQLLVYTASNSVFQSDPSWDISIFDASLPACR